MLPAEYWINHLALSPHPEGGFYRETYRSKENIPLCGLPDRFVAPRSFSTAIHFLLRTQDKSLFHRIRSDELWHFHYGGVLHIYVLDHSGLTVHKLGENLQNGEALQIMIPANCWFGAKVSSEDSYVLAGCTVSPGFDFKDFELADREMLLREHPAAHGIIRALTI